jgi:hypothetical protein
MSTDTLKNVLIVLLLVVVAGFSPEAAHCEKPSKTLLEAITGNKDNADQNVPTEPERLDPDRPHLPEASTAVGKGRMLLEGGYTFNSSGQSTVPAHDYPETLLRIGVLANWFEVRVGQNFLTQKGSLSGVTTAATGPQDLYLGVKFAITEQKRYVPELAVIPQMTVPTGSASVTAGRILPGINVDGTWEIAKNRYGIEFVVGNNRVSDAPQHSHFELDTGITNVFQVTRRLEAFGEWDMFIPAEVGNLQRPGTRHYAVAGLVFFATSNFAVDFRAGAGLNAEANRYVIGTGLAFRH